MAEEAGGAYGTPVTVTRFLEILDEELSFSDEAIESQTLRAGKTITTAYERTRKGVEGRVNFEFQNKGYVLLLKHILGAVNAPTTPGGGTLTRDQVAKLGPLDGKSLTIQVGRNDSLGTKQPFTYHGCKVNEWEFSGDSEGMLKIGVTFDGEDEDTSTALAVASYATGLKPFSYARAVLNVAGAPVDVSDWTISGNNNLKTDRYFMRGPGLAGLKKEPLADTEMRNIGGTLTAEFAGLGLYNNFKNGVETSLQIVYEGAIIEAALRYSVTFDAVKVRWDGETPTVGGADVVDQKCAFKVIDDGTGPNGPFAITVRSTDTAP